MEVKRYTNPTNPTTAVRTRAGKILQDIILEIAKEEQLNEKKIDIVLQSVFGLISATIRNGAEGVQIVHMGKFLMKPGSKVRYNNKQLEKLEKLEKLKKLEKAKLNGSNIENKG